MSKPNATVAGDSIARQFRDAPRSDPSRQPQSNSSIPDKQGGVPATPGTAGVHERLGGWTDRQIPKDKLP